MKDNQFSLYDLFGYLIPGSFLVIMIKVFKELITKTNVTFESIQDSIPKLNTVEVFIAIIFFYIIGHVINLISSYTIEIYSTWNYGYPSKYLLNINSLEFSAHFKTIHGKFWGSLIILLILPLFLFDKIFGKYSKLDKFYLKPLDNTLIKIALFKINALLIKLGFSEKNGFPNGEATNHDFFRIVQHYVFENSKKHQLKLSNYIALYGFLRTMCLNFIILFWYLLIHCYFFINCELDSRIKISILLLCLFSYIFFMAFMKFNRKYSLEAIMILVVEIEA